jgi:hypothetical protein
MAAIAIIGSLRLAESRNEKLGGSLRGLDWWGIVTVVVGLAFTSLGIDNVNTYGWAAIPSTGFLIFGLIVIGVFALIEVRVARDPLIHPPLLRNGPFMGLVVVGTIGNAGRIVFIVMATFELQTILGFDPAITGLLFISASVGIALSGPVSGWACSRWPAVQVMAIAAILGAGSLVLLALTSAIPLYVAALFVCGLACGMTYSVAQVGVQSAVPPQQSGEATSFLYLPIIALAGLAVVIASGIVEAIGGGKPTAGGIDGVLIGSAIIMGASGIVLLVLERLGKLLAPAREPVTAP